MKPGLTLRARLALSFGAAVACALLIFIGSVVGAIAIHRHSSHFRDRPHPPMAHPERRRSPDEVVFAVVVSVPVVIAGAAAFGLLLARRALAPLRDASERARAARAGDLDLTLPIRGTGDEWDELAETLNTLLADGRQSLDRIRRFTADAAHELRTPLTAIIGEADVTLRRDRSVDELRHSLEVVRDEASRVSSIIEALLLLARADAGTLLGGRNRVALDDVVRHAVKGALARARVRGRPDVSVVVEGEGAFVSGESVLLQRALENLIDNGLRYGDQAVTVRVSHENGASVVQVADGGPGVRPSLRADIFGRFVRGDAARSTEGLGLGLAIARSIAVAHGGSLELKPSERGALFVLELPDAASYDPELDGFDSLSMPSAPSSFDDKA